MASKLTGNWKGLMSFVNNFDTDVKKENTKYLDDKSKEIKLAIQNTINNQTENWTPLKDETVRRKGSNIILKETGQLVNSIEVTKEGESTYVVSPQGEHSSGLSNSELAMIHEYGTERVPPRPFISPVYEEYQQKVPKEVSTIVGKTIQKYI